LSERPADRNGEAQIDSGLFDNIPARVEKAHNQGRKVIAYPSVGSHEDRRMKSMRVAWRWGWLSSSPS
jgi:hypothetical protein